MREAGILMPVQALPANHGIGDFGSYSYEFVDLLKEAGFKIWQILPLNPLGYGNSPYQPYSSFAGDELYISLNLLQEEGLLKNRIKPFRQTSTTIDYEEVRAYKSIYLQEAYLSFVPDEHYKEFIKQEWVYQYGVFMCLKKANNYVCWNEWPTEQQNWIQDNKYDLEPYKREIDYEMFLQYEFYKQWINLKNYANNNGIQIMGDIPFYVGIDSLDVWNNQSYFLLGDDKQPTSIAGVPPDYFSKTGQRWGNPIYDWDTIKEDQYKFWIERLAYNNKLFDIIRIDHFRAFDTYYKIPSTCPTAMEGEWLAAPGYEVFDTLLKELSDINIVVEDLGDLRPEVYELKNHYNFKGMKIVQFSFDPNETNNDFEDIENMIIYTGTHDNQTIKGWYTSQPKKLQKELKKYFKDHGFRCEKIAHRFIEYTFDSIADIAVVPLYDIIDLGEEGRINVPGTLGSPNWEWRINNFKQFKENSKIIKQIINDSNRI